MTPQARPDTIQPPDDRKWPWDEQVPLAALGGASPAAAAALDRLTLEPAREGGRTVAEACREAGLDVSFVLGFLREKSAPRDSADRSGWEKQPVDAVIDHLERKHHRFTRDALVQIDRLVARALTNPAARGEVAPLLPTVRAIEASLVGHLLEEEHLLFPWIRRLSATVGENRTDARQARRRRSVATVIANLDLDHAVCRRHFADLARLTRELAPRAVSDPALCALHALLAELEADLIQHLAIEERSLFPAALAL